MSEPLSRSVARNAGLLVVAQAVSRLLGLVVLVAITRSFEVESYGRFALAMTLVTVLSPLIDLGLDQHLTRSAAQSPEQARGLLSSAIGLRLAVVAAALPLVLGVSWALGHEPQTRVLLVWLWVSNGCAVLSGAWSAIFRARGRMDLELLTTVVSKVITAGAALGAIALGRPLVEVASAQAVAAVAGTLAVGALGAATVGWPAWRGLRRDWGPLMQGALPFALTSILVMLSMRIDTLLLGQLQGVRAVGFYNAGTNLLFGAMLISQAIVTAVFPVLSRDGRLDGDAVRPLIRRTLTVSLVCSVPFALAGGLLHHRIIAAVYGAEYAPAATALAVLLAALPVLFVTNLFGHLLGAVGEQRLVLRVAATNLVVNVAFNLLLIPSLGPLGAAIATLATEMCGLLALSLMLRARASSLLAGSALARVALAAAAMAAALRLADALPLVATLALGVLAYGSVLLATGVLRAADLQALLSRGRAS